VSHSEFSGKMLKLRKIHWDSWAEKTLQRPAYYYNVYFSYF
jgi:hypothetical protein